jgi:hypothetical protein
LKERRRMYLWGRGVGFMGGFGYLVFVVKIRKMGEMGKGGCEELRK